MTHLEVPNLASLRLSLIYARGGMLLSMPLILGCLTVRRITRVAFNLMDDFASFYTAFHGKDQSLSMSINKPIVFYAAKRSSWAFNSFPAILPFSAIDKLHFQAELWPGVSEALLLHLVACMPAISTLHIKHSQHTKDEGTEGLMHLA
ncbi:hypothetical protein V8D89_004161 [Ganoderma adspersum]